MRIIADTNILVRVALRDDERQANLADALLEEAEVVAIPSIALCEFLWILQRLHRFTRAEIEAALDTLLRAANVRVNRPAVEAGLAVYRAGGDFADGVIAHEGRILQGDVFVSFDQKAVSLIQGPGGSAMLVPAPAAT